MNDPTEKEIDTDIHRSMAIFQRAEAGVPPDLHPIQPTRVLLALDGSPEDRQVATAGARLRERAGCQIAVLDSRRADHASTGPNAAEIASRFDGEQLECPALDPGYAQILAAIESWQADLVVLSCPFGEKFGELGVDSIGTDFDLLLARCPVPMLAVRAPFDDGAAILDSVKMLFSGENAVAPAAVRWSLGLISPGGSLTLALRVPDSFVNQFRDVMESMHPEEPVDLEQLEHTLASRYSAIHAQLLRHSGEPHFYYQLQVHDEGHDRVSVLPQRTIEPPLIVLGLPDRDKTGWVSDTLRHCPHPVLVVVDGMPAT